ncbi:MAG: hypothetical protein JW751_18545 [Polyangiaceae bacterium]|nr:hypothetical protein [Polyangiaceae bacterium]
MRTSLKDVNIGGFDVTLPIAGLELTFTLGPTRDLNGIAELTGGGVIARDLRLSAQTVRAGEWVIPSIGTLGITQHVFLKGVQANVELGLDDPLGLAGKVAVDGLLAERVKFSGFGCEFELRLALQHLEFTAANDRTRHVAIDRTELHEVMASTPFGNALVGEITLKGLVITLTAEGGVDLACEEVLADSIELKAKALTAQLERVSVTGLRHANGRTTLDRITVGGVTVEASELPIAGLLHKTAAAPTKPGPFVPPRLPDLPFLDQLQGHANIDAFLDVGIPIIKSRAATHAIRQELIDGTIDFKKLEAGLSGLEDAVLDFEVKPGKLILEKDIPLIPFDNTTLVWWPLEGPEQDLAKQKQRVRLRRLLDYTLTDFVTSKLQPTATVGAPLVTLRRVELNSMDIDVSLLGASQLELPFATLRLGAADLPTLKRARLAGSVKLAPGTTTAPTKVTVVAEGACCGLDRLAFLGLSLALGRLSVAAVDRLHLTFSGIVPSEVQASVSGVALERVSLDGLSLPPVRF